MYVYDADAHVVSVEIAHGDGEPAKGFVTASASTPAGTVTSTVRVITAPCAAQSRE